MQPSITDYFSFIHRRQRIWHRRFIQQIPAPWTDDPILSTFKFCNVYRELDKCTQYIMEKISGLPRNQQLLNILFYRFFNRYNLYEELRIPLIQDPQDFLSDRVVDAFNSRIKNDQRVFNDAYIIAPGGGGPKHLSVLSILSTIDPELFTQKLDSCTCPEQAHKLLQIRQAGPFLACEFFTDLTYCNFFVQGWDDDDFVNLGPGAKWGLKLIFTKPSSDQLSHLKELQRDFLGAQWKEIAYKEAASSYPYLSITNIEGCLCEFRKYWRLSQGLGKRRYYKGPQIT